MTPEEIKALADKVKAEAAQGTAELVKKQVEEAAAPLKEEIKTLKDEKKSLEEKVQKLADTPIQVKVAKSDFGTYLGPKNSVNKGVDILTSKGLFVGKEDEAAVFTKFIIAAHTAKMTGNNAIMREFYDEVLGQKGVNIVGDGASGGFLVPEVIMPTLIKKAEDVSFALRECTVIPLPVDAKVPCEDSIITAHVVGENAAGTASNPTLSQVPLVAQKIMCLTAGVSSELLQDSIVPFIGIIADQMIRAIGHKFDDLVLNGISGDADNFKGLLVAATGIQAAQLESGKYLKDMSYDQLCDAVSYLHKDDLAMAKWILSRFGLNVARKIKDDNNNPIWASLATGTPANILGNEYITNESAPSAVDKETASKIFGVLGNLKKYYIGLRPNSWTLQSDPYTLFSTDMTRFKMTVRAGGNPVSKSAFAVLKAGAAVTTTTTTSH